ncbi:hypothetical protein MRX96_006331 [Rhipicephalus microplus]
MTRMEGNGVGVSRVGHLGDVAQVARMVLLSALSTLVVELAQPYLGRRISFTGEELVVLDEVAVDESR